MRTRRRSGLNMKLTHQRITGRYDSTPESVLDWLEEQLECRGIDAVVYTRYILSLLQDEDSDDDQPLQQITADVTTVQRRHSSVKESLRPAPTNKWKHRRYRTTCLDIGQDCWPHYQCAAINSDYERKLAVVQCLKSASEQEFGIESFVDELCAKLKNIKLLSESVPEMTSEPELNNNNGVKVSFKEQALKYYAAFPALDHNCNEDPPLVPKTGDDVREEIQNLVQTSPDKNKWNGQKIIEFINGNSSCDQQKDDNQVINSVDIKQSEESNVYYCEDIETIVMDVPLVDNNPLNPTHSPNVCYFSEDGIQEENDRFERLVNKFNRNIASIWSTPESDAVLAKNDNIWSFDSSFSSNQSSATPSPKSCAMDVWSSFNMKQLNEPLEKRLTRWGFFNTLSDDGFIDSNDFFDDDINWCFSHTDLCDREANKVSLQNHQKNSPFIEFNAKTSHKESQFNRLMSLASLLDHSDNRMSPVMDENLLTSSKTHFQPIKQDSLEKDQSEDDSVSDITDKEVIKLVICSDKCPNNSDTKQPTYDSLTLRPISTSFGELASFMGPFNDFEWSDEHHSKPAEGQMSDKSTNTESECQTEINSRLSSIVETSVECEPEYQDLYQMINEALLNGLQEEDNTSMSSPLTAPDNCDKSGADLFLNSLEANDCHSIGRQTTDLENGSDYTVDHLFADKLFGKDMFESYSHQEQILDDCFSCANHLDESFVQLMCEPPNRANRTPKSLDSPFKLQYQRRHNQNVGEANSEGSQGSGRVRKPCSFFIDGNCKRSDCKYSHHISAITCKYWEEGFCFKAELCPFLHGYFDDANYQQMDDTSLEGKSYAIESESDFPSLSTKCGESVPQVDSSADCVEQHFFDLHTKSVADTNRTIGSSKAKLPIAVFMKKKLRKRKDRNLQ